MKGLKTTLIRGTQTIKQKLGKTDKTIDEEYENIHNKTLATEKQAQNFSKHVNQLIENYHAMSTTLSFLAEDIRDLYATSEPNSKQRQMADQLTRMAEVIEQNCVLRFQSQVKANVVEPADEYLVQFPPLKDLHKKRENAVLEYDYFRDKVQNMSEKQNKDPLALPKAKEKMNQTKDDFDLLNNSSKSGMTEVLDRKDIVFNSAVEQLFANIVQFYERMASETQNLKSGAAVREAPLSSSQQPSQSFSSSQKVMYPKVQTSASPSSSGVPPEFDIEFFYLDAELERHGPLTFMQLKQKFNSGEVNADTYVFAGQMPDWTQIGAVPNLKYALSS
jgi:uncharacterized protein YoxC